MEKHKNYNFATKCVHAGVKPDPTTGAIMTPIFQSSTYAQESPGQHKGYEYSRSHNPTRTALEKALASLEHAEYGLCFSSGCAAMTAIMLNLNPLEHVLSMHDLYGGTHRLFNQVFRKFGIDFSYADLSNIENIERNLKKNTKIIWLETPTNPLLKLADIKQISNIAKNHNILVVVDNTFASPALQNPLLLGADIVVHSTTKYLGGHSDVVGGAILTNNQEWATKLAFIAKSVGGVPAPFDCFLTLRGIKTLDIRMKRHCENALEIATFLNDHPKVKYVIYPGLKSHPQYNLAQNQMVGPSGMLSFILKDGLNHAKKVCEKTRVFTCAESLGGVESLIEHPGIMTHASLSSEERAKIGIDDGLLRLSVGIENSKDLIKDLEEAIL